jgi:DNA-binding transcriptional LysR family regulator
MLHSRLLHYLDAVARAGSIRKAAEELSIAASAINRRILALEAELGTPVFERLHKRLRLTSAGEMVVSHVRQTLREHERMQTRIEDLKGLRRGQVTIATMPTLASEVLPALIAQFRERHSRTTVLVKVLRDIEQTVANDEADLGFGFNLAPNSSLVTHASTPMRFGAVVAPDRPLAQQQSASLASCASYPLILPEPDMSVRPDLDRAIAALGGEIDVALETNAIELIKRAAGAGVGVAFLPHLPVRGECERGELVYLPLRDKLLGPQHLSVVRRAHGRLDGLAARMAESLRLRVNAIGEAERP